MSILRKIASLAFRQLPRRYRIGVPVVLGYLLVGSIFVFCPFLFELPGRLAPMDSRALAKFEERNLAVAAFDSEEGPLATAQRAVEAQEAIVKDARSTIPWIGEADPEDQERYNFEAAILEDLNRDLQLVEEDRERALTELRATQGVFSPLCVSETRELFTSVYFGWQMATTKLAVVDGIVNSAVKYNEARYSFSAIGGHFGWASIIGVGHFLLRLPFWLAEYDSNMLSFLLFWFLSSAGAVTFVILFFAAVLVLIFIGLIVLYTTLACGLAAWDWVELKLGMRPPAAKKPTGTASAAATAGQPIADSAPPVEPRLTAEAQSTTGDTPQGAANAPASVPLQTKKQQ